MPSVGFVISHLTEGNTAESEDLLEKWSISQELHQSWFNKDEIFPYNVYVGYEDPSLVIQMSPWSCPEEQLEEFAHSEEMEDYLLEFGDVLELAGAFHLELKWNQLPVDAEFASIGRYWVTKENKDKFLEAWAKFQPVQEGVAGSFLGCAWRTKGGWQDAVEEDHGKRLAGLKGREEKLGDYMAGDEEDDGMLEFVVFLGWDREETLSSVNMEIQKDIGERRQEWGAFAPVVAASSKMTVHHLKKVKYDLQPFERREEEDDEEDEDEDEE